MKKKKILLFESGSVVIKDEKSPNSFQIDGKDYIEEIPASKENLKKYGKVIKKKKSKK